MMPRFAESSCPFSEKQQRPAVRILFQHKDCGIRLLILLVTICMLGCHLPRWRNQAEVVMAVTASKEEIITHLNQNVIGTEDHPGLQSWRSGAVRLHVDGVPIALPASIAVQSPRNFRLLVSNPLTGGQEVDIGSNPERFWIWPKESPQVMTASHEDVGLAIQELEMPVHIHPDWLMEVFGVIPLNAEEFVLKRPKVENGHVELVASRQSPLGEDVEKVLVVNVVRGRISEHLLRLPGGKVLARARMDKYTQLKDGQQMPLLISLEWPDAHMKMVMDIRNPECNVESLKSSVSLWEMPHHGQVVDIGAIARARIEPSAIQVPGQQQPLDAIRAKIRIPDAVPVSRESSSSTPVRKASSEEEGQKQQGDDLPDWAK